MKKLLVLVSLISTSAFANLHLAPPDFNNTYGRAIFVDFKTADYDITYDVRKKRTSVKTKIVFKAEKNGKPLFDLIPLPKNAKLNGEPVTIVESTSPDGSKLRLVDSDVAPGEHVLELENTFKENVRYRLLSRKVSSAFWIRDLKYRKFMEQYIPSNFEFDQYQMTMNVTFAGIKTAKQDIYTNGTLTQTSPNSFKIEYPSFYTVSCPYFHTTPKGQKKRLDFTYKSIDGRDLPVTVYTSWWSHPRKFKAEAIRVFQELEADYGPWGHKGLVAYETLPGTGGMEHAGATQTSFGALDHEMLHSYFAKGVMPANGNSGWIDEAIASWRDKGYQRKPLPDFTGSNLGSQSVYKRNTDSRSYALGAEFMAYLDYRLQDIGGLKAFLKGYFQAYKHTVITTEHFKNNLEFFSGLDLTDDFNTYILGTNSKSDDHLLEANPHHLELSDEQVKSLL
jgi:hypothetical protein